MCDVENHFISHHSLSSGLSLSPPTSLSLSCSFTPKKPTPSLENLKKQPPSGLVITFLSLKILGFLRTRFGSKFWRFEKARVCSKLVDLGYRREVGTSLPLLCVYMLIWCENRALIVSLCSLRNLSKSAENRPDRVGIDP